MSTKEKNKLVNLRYAEETGRTNYLGVLKDIENAKVCPFCPKTFKWHTKPILKKYGGWLITENFNPYPNTKYHLIVVKKDHKEKFQELKASDFKAISYLINWAIKKYKIRGGGVTMRFGDSDHTGATVSHIHAHLIVPKLKDGKAIPVYFPIG